MLLSSMLLAFHLGSVAQEAPQMESVAHGVRWTAPDSSWTLQQTSQPGSGPLQVQMTRMDGEDAVQLTLQVHRASAAMDATATREAKFEELRGATQYRELSRVSRELAGETAPGISLHADYRGKTYRLEQFFTVSGGFLTTHQQLAPLATYADYGEDFDAGWSGLGRVELSAEAAREGELRQLARRCRERLAWADDWADAAKKATERNRNVVVLVQKQAGFDDIGSAVSTLLMNRDLAQLIDERFVPLHHTPGQRAGFVRDDRYRMGPSTFGASLLVVTPAGRVIADTFVGHPAAAYEMLRGTLTEELRPPLPGTSPAEDVAASIRRGELDLAEELIGLAPEAGRSRFLAQVARLRGDGGECLSLLGDAADAEALFERGLAHAAVGDLDAAEARMRELLEDHGEHDLAGPALLHLGVLRLRARDAGEARSLWSELVETRPDEPCAWAAATGLLSESLRHGVGGRIERPDADVMHALRQPRSAKLDSRKAASAERDAAVNLAATQREDGSWISPVESAGLRAEIPNPLVYATTALAARALLAYAGGDSAAPDSEASLPPGLPPDFGVRSAEAVRKAADFLASEQQRLVLAESLPRYMDYRVWAEPAAAFFLLDAVDAGTLARDSVAATIQTGVDYLEKIQNAGGGWSYLLTQDLGSKATLNVTMSFTTAWAIEALQRAKDAGFEVQDRTLNRALDCLQSLRNVSGPFEYLILHDSPGPRDPGRAGASGRGPQCMRVLHRAGRATVADLAGALDLFLEFGPDLALEQRKTLMHAGPGGLGSHYVQYDFMQAASTLQFLPDEQRREYRWPILDLVLSGRLEDGDFVDNPMIGRAAGTAMALRSLQLLR